MTWLVIVLCTLHFEARKLEAQSNPLTRSFTVEGTYPNDPLRILGFKVNGTIVKSGASFSATDEAWLKTSSIVIKNVSQKTVMGLWVFGFFPEGDDGHSGIGSQLSMGHAHPEELYHHKGGKLSDTSDPLLTLLPGQTMEFPLAPLSDYLQNILEIHKPFIAQGLTACRIRFVTAYFTDGMRWSPNWFKKLDPDNPGQYVEIKSSEFYGYDPQK
jgi:hypothetical protein